MEVVALMSCALALFYYSQWRRTREDLDALHEAVCRVGRGEAEVVQVGSNMFHIEDI